VQRIGQEASLIDVGGGDSTLVDDLLDLGYSNPTVLDVSPAALQRARQRLGSRAEGVSWIEADITWIDLTANTYDLWHDRAVFHFLAQFEERGCYIQALNRALKPGGTAILAGFAPDGPERCSGLDVVRIEPGGSAGAGQRLPFTGNPAGEALHAGRRAAEFIYCTFQKDWLLAEKGLINGFSG
jgi:SAM-dependent methyltransferase